MPTYVDELRALKESGAELVSYQSVPEMSVVHVTRLFPGIKDALRVSSIAFLDKFISPLNTTEIAAVTQAFTVNNPLVDG